MIEKFPGSEYIFYHKTPIQIRFNDIDPVGHVNNAVYQEYFDCGRMAYFEKILKIKENIREEWVVIANITTDYINQVYLHDKIRLESKIPVIGNKSFTMHQRVIIRKGGKDWIAAYNKTVLVGMNLVTNETMQILPKWRERIAKYEKDITF